MAGARRLSRPTLAADLHVGLVDVPGSTGLAGESIPALFELGHEALDSSHDGRVGQGQTALGHQFDQITQAQLVAELPANAQNDDLPLEMPAVEHIVHAFQPLRHRSALNSKAIACRRRDLHQRLRPMPVRSRRTGSIRMPAFPAARDARRVARRASMGTAIPAPAR